MRTKGDHGRCCACGQSGHYGSRSGCSPTYLAAKLVIDGQATITQAAIRMGVKKQTVSQFLIRNGHRQYRPRAA